MNHASSDRPPRAALASSPALVACASPASRSPRSATRRRRRAARPRRRRTPRPTRRSTSRSSTSNANKKGPALVVIPGEIKSNNATFLQKFTANNIADFGEIELSSANFQVLERSNLGPAAARVRARLQPRRSRRRRASSCGMGKLKSDQVRRQVRHPEDRAGRRGAVGLRRPRDRPDGRRCSARSAARAAARRRARWAAPRSARCTPASRPASGSSACATRSSTPRPPSSSRRATPRRRWRSARRRRSVLGVSQSQQGGVSLDTMVQRLVQKSRLGNRQQVQVTATTARASRDAGPPPASPFSGTARGAPHWLTSASSASTRSGASSGAARWASSTKATTR